MTEIPLNAEALRAALNAAYSNPLTAPIPAIEIAIRTYLAASGVQAVVEAAGELERTSATFTRASAFDDEVATAEALAAYVAARSRLGAAVAALKETPDAN